LPIYCKQYPDRTDGGNARAFSKNERGHHSQQGLQSRRHEQRPLSTSAQPPLASPNVRDGRSDVHASPTGPKTMGHPARSRTLPTATCATIANLPPSDRCGTATRNRACLSDDQMHVHSQQSRQCAAKRLPSCVVRRPSTRRQAAGGLLPRRPARSARSARWNSTCADLARSIGTALSSGMQAGTSTNSDNGTRFGTGATNKTSDARIHPQIASILVLVFFIFLSWSSFHDR
jgi:hypothetical protein